MAVTVKEVVLYAQLGLRFCIRTSYRLACKHPFTSGLVFFMLLLYRCFPGFFAFLVSSSPVIICTTLLLGTLLSYGEPNLPEVEDKEDKKTRGISALIARSAAAELVVKKDDTFAFEAATLLEGSATASTKLESYFPSTVDHDEEERKNVPCISPNSLAMGFKKETHAEKKGAEESELLYQGLGDVQNFYVAKVHKEFTGHDLEPDRPMLENEFGSSLGSPWQPVERHDASSDSESDHAESSSPDASMADILPMLDELHPLLDSEPSHHGHKSNEDSDAASRSSSEDHEADDSGAEEDAERREEEEKEEVDEKDDGTDAAVKWTADDQKNLMDLGSSELERNERLERLIAKRRARKRLETSKNFIDLDPNEVDPIMEQLLSLNVQIRPISAIRRNPFDLPYDSDEAMGLPPMPGSAPPVLLPRQNPFDLPDDPSGETGGLTGGKTSHNEFESCQQREMFFRRHESFSVGPSFPGDLERETRGSRLRPYFVAESADSEATGCATFQRQLSADSDRKARSASESDSVSSLMDLEDSKELVEQEYHQETELLSPADHTDGPVELQSQSSDDTFSVDVEQEAGLMNMGDDNRVASGITEGTNQVVDVLGAAAEAIQSDEQSNLPTSGTEQLEEIEEEFDDSSSSSSLEINDKGSKMSIGEESAAFGNISHSLNNSSIPLQAVISALNHVNGEVERIDDSQVVDPVYDSSPSATERSLSNVAALDEELSYGGKDGLHSRTFTSDLQVENLEASFIAPSEGEAIDLHQKSTEEDSSSGTTAVQMVHHSGLPSAPLDLESCLESETNGLTSPTLYLDGMALLVDSTLAESEEEHKNLRNPASVVGLEELQLSILNLPPIPEENLLESRLGEQHDSTAVREYEGSDAVVTSGISLVDHGFTGLDTDPKESTAFSSQSEVRNHLEFEHDSAISEFHSVQEGDILKASFISEEESGEAHSKAKDYKIDEHILSELDVVGDFHVDELISDERVFQMKLQSDGDDISGVESLVSTEMPNITPQLQALEDRSRQDVDVQTTGTYSEIDPEQTVYNSKLCILEQCSSKEIDSVSNELIQEATFSDVGQSSTVAACKEQEPIGTDPEILVLEAKSIDDINLAFKQFTQASPDYLVRHMKSTASDTSLQVIDAKTLEDVHLAIKQHSDVLVENPNNSMQSKEESMEVEANQSHIEPVTLEGSDGTKTDSQFLVLEAKAIADISLAFKQLHRGDDIVYSEVRSSDALRDDTHEEKPTKIHSDMHVVEAKSLEDIHLALNKHTDGVAQVSPKPLEHTNIPAGAEATARLLEPEVLEVRSVEEIEVALKEAITKESRLRTELQAESSTEAETVHSISDSTTLKKKILKKNKSGKSTSSSSSSSSDSE